MQPWETVWLATVSWWNLKKGVLRLSIRVWQKLYWGGSGGGGALNSHELSIHVEICAGDRNIFKIFSKMD